MGKKEKEKKKIKRTEQQILKNSRKSLEYDIINKSKWLCSLAISLTFILALQK